MLTQILDCEHPRSMVDDSSGSDICMKCGQTSQIETLSIVTESDISGCHYHVGGKKKPIYPFTFSTKFDVGEETEPVEERPKVVRKPRIPTVSQDAIVRSLVVESHEGQMQFIKGTDVDMTILTKELSTDESKNGQKMEIRKIKFIEKLSEIFLKIFENRDNILSGNVKTCKLIRSTDQKIEIESEFKICQNIPPSAEIRRLVLKIFKDHKDYFYTFSHRRLINLSIFSAIMKSHKLLVSDCHCLRNPEAETRRQITSKLLTTAYPRILAATLKVTDTTIPRLIRRSMEF